MISSLHGMLWKHLLVILHCTTLHHVRKHTTRSHSLSSKIKDKFDGERLGREKFHGWNCQAHQNYKSRVKFDRDWYDINSLAELSLIEVRLIDERFTKYEK